MSDYCHVLTAKISNSTFSFIVDSKLMRLGEGIFDEHIWDCLLIVLKKGYTSTTMCSHKRAGRDPYGFSSYPMISNCGSCPSPVGSFDRHIEAQCMLPAHCQACWTANQELEEGVICERGWRYASLTSLASLSPIFHDKWISIPGLVAGDVSSFLNVKRIPVMRYCSDGLLYGFSMR